MRIEPIRSFPITVILALALAVVCGCGGGGDGGSVQQGGAIVNFGLRTGDSQAAAAVAATLGGALAEQGIPAAPAAAPVACPPGATMHGETAACFDARLLLPFVPDRKVDLLYSIFESHDLFRRIEEDEVHGPLVSFIQHRGVSLGESTGILFALRKLSTPKDRAAGHRKRTTSMSTLDNATLSGGTALDPVTVDSLIWTDSTVVIAKDAGYEQRVFAPGFAGGEGSSGTWVLYGLGARAKNGDLKCLRGRFRDLWTGQVTTVDSGDCSSMEQYVELSTTQVATGVEMKISDNNVKGLGLGYGRPTYVVDPIFPDFLLDVSPTSYVFSGSSSGTYAPDSAKLTATWPYVVVGVEARASDSKVTGLTVHLGRLTAPGAAADDIWRGHTVADIEAATVEVLNAIYGEVTRSVQFEVASGCPSTIPSIEFCGTLAAEDSYSSSEMDSVCAGTCDAYYESCKVSQDACKVACCYGCTWGKWCSCNYNCSKERDSCYNGCTQTFSGSAAVDVRNVTGLEKLEFTQASVPFLTDGASIGVEATAVVSPGLVAAVYWRLCQSGICVSDTTALSSSTMKVRARGVLTAEACPVGDPALYLTIDQTEIIDPGVWNIDQLVGDIVGVVQSSLDWLAENISDLFYYDLQGSYDDLIDAAIGAIEGALNSLLVDVAIIPCSDPPADDEE